MQAIIEAQEQPELLPRENTWIRRVANYEVEQHEAKKLRYRLAVSDVSSPNRTQEEAIKPWLKGCLEVSFHEERGSLALRVWPNEKLKEGSPDFDALAAGEFFCLLRVIRAQNGVVTDVGRFISCDPLGMYAEDLDGRPGWVIPLQCWYTDASEWEDVLSGRQSGWEGLSCEAYQWVSPGASGVEAVVFIELELQC